MDKKYYIDKLVLSYLMNPKDAAELETNHDNYLSVLNELIQKQIRTFLKEKGRTDEEITRLFTQLEAEAQNEDANPSIEALKDPELEKIVTSSVDVFDKAIYDQYLPTLTETQKFVLNDYLQSVQTTYRVGIDYINTVLGIVPEEEVSKKQQESPEVTATNSTPNQQDQTQGPIGNSQQDITSINLTKTE